MAELKIERINYLKMDIEGAEHKVFETFKDHDKIDVLALELHGEREQLIKELHKHYIFVDIWQYYPEYGGPLLSADNVEHPINDLDFLIHRCPPNYLCINRKSKGITF
jgi:hypothetical protein